MMKQNSTSKNSVMIAAIGAITYLLVFLTYAQFFTFVPSSQENLGFGYLLVASSVCWLLAMLVPLVSWMIGTTFSRWKTVAYFSGVFAWPVSVVVIQVYLAGTAGTSFFGYLFNYPIFVLSDMVYPLVYALLWRGSAQR
jgi:magnesium-transporting ATPase (P-type)